MKLTPILYAALATGVFTGAAQASPYDTAVEAANPLAYYNFNTTSGTTTTDATSNGYTLNLNNGASVQSGSGPTINGTAAPALILNNGSSGNAYAGSGGSNPEIGGISTAGTIIAWIDLASLPSTQGRIFSIAGTSAYGDDLDLQVENDQLRFYSDGGSYTGAPTQFTSTDLNKWIFVAATFTAGSDRELYINGALVSSSVPGGHYDSGNPFYIGQSNVFGGRYFDGAIADVAFYNTDLTGTQITSIYGSAAISGVPEPSTWAMMFLGFAALGFAGYRQSKQTSIALAV